MTTAIYPGRFDPVTAGHLDILQRASRLFDKVIIAVFEAPEARTTFSAAERVGLIREAAGSIPNVEAQSFSGLVVDYAKARHATAIVRGIRMHADFEYEFEMALMNRRLAPDVDSAFLMTSLEHLYVSATRVRELAGFGRDVSDMTPPHVAAALREKFGN